MMASRVKVMLLSLLLSIYFVRRSCAGGVPIPKDVLFMIDGSGSVKPHNFDKLRVFIKRIVDTFYVGGPSGTNVALIQFSSRKLTKVEFNLDRFDNKQDIKKAIDDMVYQQKYTYTGYAMKLARREVFNGRGGDRPRAKNILMIFTDGEAADPHIARAESKEMKSNGAHVMSIGFGPRKSVEKFKDELEVMASSKDDDVFLNGLDDLNDIQVRLLEAVEPKNDCSTFPCRNGATCINVGTNFRCECTEDYEGYNCAKKKGVCAKKPCLNGGICEENGEDFKCICSENFSGTKCQKEKVVCTTKNADILFVVDGSRSIKSTDFDKMKTFITQLVYRFNISRFETRVALIQFSDRDKAVVEFPLNYYNSKSGLMRKIEDLKLQNGGTTYTDEALKIAREHVFTGLRGDRPGIRNVLILLTDGEAHDTKAAIREADMLKGDDDVSIISIGVGKGETIGMFIELLEGIASKPSYVFKADYSKLETIVDFVITAACENLGDI